MTWRGLSYLEFLQEERIARKLTRLGKLRENLLQTDNRVMSLRDLETRHTFKQQEARSLVKAFPEKLQIIKKPVGPQGVRPSEIILIPSVGYRPAGE